MEIFIIGPRVLLLAEAIRPAAGWIRQVDAAICPVAGFKNKKVWCCYLTSHCGWRRQVDAAIWPAAVSTAKRMNLIVPKVICIITIL